MKHVLVLLIVGTVVSGIAAYASTARTPAAADTGAGTPDGGVMIPAETVAPR